MSSSLNRRLMATVAGVALLLVGAVEVNAQTAGGASVPSFAKLPDSIIAQFKANPQGLLTTYASAGLPLSTQVRSLVLTDSTLVGTIIDLAKRANDAQRAAMGAGLAEAARILAATNPQLAAQIQTDVAQSGLTPLITAFIAGSNGVQTAATGGGATGGGGAGGGGPAGGVGNSGGSNGGSNPGGVSFGAVNGASAFGSLGSGGGGVTLTGQSTSPSSI